MNLKNLNDYEGNKKIRDQNEYVLKILENEKFLPCPILFAYVIKKNENSNRLFCTHLNKGIKTGEFRKSSALKNAYTAWFFLFLVRNQKIIVKLKKKKKKERGEIGESSKLINSFTVWIYYE